jgi:hypothetical protein
VSIVATEIESIHGVVGQQRLIYYRCQDSDGVWHGYGPVISNDSIFDADAHKTIVAEKVAEALAASEISQLLEGN